MGRFTTYIIIGVLSLLVLASGGLLIQTNSKLNNAHTIRSATYVVAASNASPNSKAQADFVCDGSDDNVEIQAAIDALPVTGGIVHLTEGAFNISAPISIYRRVANWGPLWLQGSGIKVTTIFLQDHTNSNMIENIVIDYDAGFKKVSDMMLNANKAKQTSGNGIYSVKTGKGQSFDQQYENIYVDGMKDTGIYITSAWGVDMTNILSEHNGGDGIYLQGTQNYMSHVYVKGNYGNGLFLLTDQGHYTNVQSEANGKAGVVLQAGRWNNFSNFVVRDWGGATDSNYRGFQLGSTGKYQNSDFNTISGISISGNKGSSPLNYPMLIQQGTLNSLSGLVIDDVANVDYAVVLANTAT